MQNLPTLRQMQYLLALDHHKNFRKAAEECNVTQSTLSGAIGDMEEILRTPVIDRAHRKTVRLTPLGEDLLATARHVLAKMEDITNRACRIEEPLSRPLRLGIIPTIAPYLLPRLLKPLQKALPKLELHIHELRSAQIVEKLHDGSIDLGLLAFPFEMKGLYEKPVIKEKFLLAAPPGHFKDKKKISMKDVGGEKLLLLEDGHCMRDHALDACKTQSIREMKSLSAASMSTLIQLVHQGYGVTFIPEMAVNDSSLPKNLTLRNIDGGGPTRTIGFSWKKSGLREKDIKLVTGEIERLVKRHS